jgi:DNA-binding GntR family transcriptional regulator
VPVQIDHEAAEFPFQQLAAIIRTRIQDGTYDRRLPPLTELEAESGLSPMAVRRAVRLLVDEGLVRTVPGRGTFVVRDRA